MALEFNSIVFGQAQEQFLRGFVFGEVTVKPVIFGCVFGESKENFMCVVTDKSGSVLSGVTVNIINSIDNLSYTTDSEGFVEGMLRKEVSNTIVISKAGYKTNIHTFTLADNDIIDWRITLYKITQSISVSGNVLISLNPTEQENQIFE